MNKPAVSGEAVDALYKKQKRETEAAGYHLNPDEDFTKLLVRSLLVNEERYGYPACPCRLASGKRGEDLDIICPCDYRDPDLNDFGACYCALYVSADIALGKKKAVSIPERRPTEAERKKREEQMPAGGKRKLNPSMPVWRCNVCGYLCAREHPPEVCPICKASKDRFERFM